jgi:hypothetical protein
MKARRYLFLAMFLHLGVSVLGQEGFGFKAPAKGKSVVYFVRTAAYQYSVPFTFFDGKSLIADFPSRYYFRYECEPGTHLFWASCENKEFLHAELKANETYIVMAEALHGDGLPRVSLIPINTRHKEFHKAKYIIFNKAPVVENEQTIKEENERMRGFIEKSVSEYEAANIQPELVLNSDLAIPIEKIK